MNCQDVRTQLDCPGDATEPTLAPDAQAHLGSCAECARYRERLAAIREPASVLPREIQPPRDLWADIASRLDAEDERKIWRIPRFLPLAAAAGIAALLATSLFSLPPRRSETVAVQPVREAESPPAPATRLLPAATVEIGFVQTRSLLLKRFEAQKNGAPPERVAVIEQTLSAVDTAIRDIHAALERDPYNAALLFKLSDTRRRELRLLQQVVL